MPLSNKPGRVGQLSSRQKGTKESNITIRLNAMYALERNTYSTFIHFNIYFKYLFYLYLLCMVVQILCILQASRCLQNQSALISTGGVRGGREVLDVSGNGWSPSPLQKQQRIKTDGASPHSF